MTKWRVVGSHETTNWSYVHNVTGASTTRGTYNYEVSQQPLYHFFRLLITANGGWSDMVVDEWIMFSVRPALEERVNALDTRAKDNSTAIVSIENKFVITYDGGEFLDPNSYVVTRSSLWYNHENNGDYDAYKLFDGDENTVTNFIMDNAGVDGVAFTEFEMGEFVHVSGFRMKPRDTYKDRFPRDTRLFSGTSSSGLWTQIGTSILATSPSNDSNIIVEFPSASSRYFRVVFTNAPRDLGCDIITFDLIATQSIDVIENINSRITQLENVPPGTTDLGPLETSVGDNTSRIETLENGGGGGGGGGSTDLGPLKARVDALETAGADNRTVVKGNINRIQTLEIRMTDLGSLENNFSVLDNNVDDNSSNITSLSGCIQTLENGGGGGGGESVDLGPLEESVSAIDTRVGVASVLIDGNTTRIQQLDTDVMRVASRTLTLEAQVGRNTSNIYRNTSDIDRNTSDIDRNSNRLAQLEIITEDLLLNKVKNLETQYTQLDTLYTNTASNVQSVITQQNLIRNRVLALEQAPKTIYYKSQEFRLNQYQNGMYLQFLHPMNYDPVRIDMKARDINTGFIYTVNPGHDYGFNYRHRQPSDSRFDREIEVAIGSTGLYLMTLDGSKRNILTGQRCDRFYIYAIMEFVPNIPRLTYTVQQQETYDDGSLNY